jgi:hypothetical protein
MYCLNVIGSVFDQQRFIHFIKDQKFSLYQWSSLKIKALDVSHGFRDCFLLVKDFRQFWQKEKNYYSFAQELDQYENIHFLFLHEVARIELEFFLSSFFNFADCKILTFQFLTSNIKTTYSYYLGECRDQLYGLIHRNRGGRIGVLTGEDNLEKELSYWAGQNVRVGRFSQVKTSELLDLVFFKSSELKDSELKILFVFPEMKDFSWKCRSANVHVYLHTDFLELLLKKPATALRCLAPFYRYRLL